MNNRKSPFGIIVGIMLIIITILLVFADFEFIKTLFSSFDPKTSIPLIFHVIALYGIYAVLSIAAFVSIKHKAAMFGVTLFAGAYALYYTSTLIFNADSLFGSMSDKRFAVLLAYLLTDVCFILSIVHLAVFKAFRGNNAQVAANPQPQYQEQQYQEQYQQQYQQQNNNQNQGFQGYNNNNNDIGSF